MKSSRKARLPVAGRTLQPGSDESGATAPGTVVYIGQTKGPKPTKYFLTLTLEGANRVA